MCTNFMEMKKRRGYAEMRLLLRRTNVNFSSYGEPLLEIAIMSYLKDGNQSLEDLMKNAEENSPMSIPEGETAFDLIKDALQNVYTRHSFKVESDEVVAIYISSIVADIRIEALLKMMEAEKGLDVSIEDRENVISVCKRCIFKPKDTSKEILNHVAGRRGYNDIEGLLESFIKYLDIPEEQKEQFSEMDKLHEFNNFVKKVLREKDNMNF